MTKKSILKKSLFAASATWLVAVEAYVGHAATKPYPAGWGFDTAGMNRNVKPGDDFFTFANGTYIKKIRIPDDRSSFGAFDVLAETARERVNSLLREAGRNAPNSPVTTSEKLGVYYATFLDEAKANQLGKAPLEPYLAEIRNAHDVKSAVALFGKASCQFFYSPFEVSITAGFNDPTKYVIALGQGRLGMPDRDYYLKPEFAAKKKAYHAYIEKMLGLIDWPNAALEATRIVTFETELAKAEWPLQALRNPLRLNNPMSLAQLQTKVPEIDWSLFLTQAGIKADDFRSEKLVVLEPAAIRNMAAHIAGLDNATRQAWMAFHLADNAAPYLSHDLVQASFDFNEHELDGQPKLSARWKQAVSATSSAMGWAVGEQYVKRYFPPSAKASISSLVGEVKAVFAQRLRHNPWMSPGTRDKALRKLDNFRIEVGYPSKWRDYAGLDVRKDDLFGNASRAAMFDWQHELTHIGKDVDRTEWEMTPQTVNAYNEPTQVEIVFPAAILQPPFFDPNGDMAVNYGAIGGVIGHEMTHSFDDEGRQFDEKGRVHQWWSPEDVKRFNALADRFGAQYEKFEVFPGLHLNSRLTMGENIADLGGLTLALNAYHASLKGKSAPVLHGLTGDQRVFLGWAQVWRQKLRDDVIKKRVTTDPHSPPKARVNLPMHNLNDWFDAFDVKPTDKLYIPPEQRVVIW